MSIVSSHFNFFLLLLLLVLCINKNVAREIARGAAKNIETAYDSGKTDDDDGHGSQNGIHQHNHAHASSSSSSITHMDLSLNLFFHIEDLKIGQKIPLYFPIKDPSTVPHMISKEEADSIPFSKTQLSQILDFFKFTPDSKQAKAIKETLEHCQIPPIKGESKFCATSLESMLENLSQIFGLGNNFNVLTTTQMRNWNPKLQNYTILEDPKEISAPIMVGCHPVPYPYAVFYCHGQKGDTKLFMLSLEAEMDGVRLEAVGICHMDTSQWDPSHASFRLLGIEPGTSPVCHIFPQDNLVWVSSPSSVN